MHVLGFMLLLLVAMHPAATRSRELTLTARLLPPPLPPACHPMQVAYQLRSIPYVLLDAAAFEGLSEAVAVGALGRVLQAVSGTLCAWVGDDVGGGC